MFQLSAIIPNRCPQLKSSLVNSDQRPSAGCLNNCHSDVASTRQHLAQNFNRPAPISLPRFCNLCTEVWNVKKSQVGRYWSIRHLATKLRDDCVCVYSALAHCAFKP